MNIDNIDEPKTIEDKPVSKKPINDRSMKNDLKKEIIIERYKFILNEITNLNSNVHRYINLFQIISTAIIGGGIAIFVSWNNLQFDPDKTIQLIESLKYLLVLITLFFIALIVVSIFSWWDFRKEETTLINSYFKENFRESPKIKSMFRWSETWFIIFLIVFIIIVVKYIDYIVIPLIN